MSKAAVEWMLVMLRNLTKYLRQDASGFRAAQQGATIVEFALIVPVFLALLR
jgi:Flp pilus assembly protein TadG